jgi:hypothetical protein
MLDIQKVNKAIYESSPSNSRSSCRVNTNLWSISCFNNEERSSEREVLRKLSYLSSMTARFVDPKKVDILAIGVFEDSETTEGTSTDGLILLLYGFDLAARVFKIR